MRKNIVLAVAAAIILGGIAGLAIVRDTTNNTQATATATPTPALCASPAVTEEKICYTGEEGKTALALLKERHQVTEKETSFGPMVTGINGKVADDQHFWSFYVNETFASEGAHTYTTKDGEKIEWKYETIQ